MVKSKRALPIVGTHVVMGIGRFVLQYSASTHIAAAVVGFGVLALGDTAAACRVDEMECVIVVDAGNDTNVANASASRAALEEHQVARLQVIPLDANAIIDLAS